MALVLMIALFRRLDSSLSERLWLDLILRLSHFAGKLDYDLNQHPCFGCLIEVRIVVPLCFCDVMMIFG